jgi:hypothetical protein
MASCLMSAACGTPQVDPRVLAMEKTASIGVACLRDAERLDFGLSRNCEKVAAGVAPERQSDITGLSQTEANRLGVASLQAKMMLWRAYSISADRKIHRPDGTTSDSLINRVYNPKWFQRRRAECLHDRDTVDCRTAVKTDFQIPEPLYL